MAHCSLANRNSSLGISTCWLKWLVLLSVLIFSSSLYAALPLLTPPSQPSAPIELTPYMELLEDASQQLNLPQVIQAEYDQQFKAAGEETPYIGHTHSAWWVRFQLYANEAQDWFLLLDQPIGGSIQMFSLPYPTKSTLTPLENYRLPAYRLLLAPQETITIYVRVTNAGALLSLPLKLMSAEQLITTSNQQAVIFAALFAGMTVLGIYNLLLFFSVREYAYLRLVSFIVFVNLTFIRDSNLFPSLAWINNTDNYFYAAPLLLVLVSAFYYWMYVNEGVSVIMDKLSRVVIYLALGLLPFIGLIENAEAFIFSCVLGLMPCVVILISVTAIRGHRPTQHAYAAAMILIIGLIPYALMQAGWGLTYNRNTAYLAQSSVLLALLLLSYVQGERTRLLREQKERAEAINNTKDEFLTIMSHELRTPLHAVIGAADLLQQTVLSPEQHQYLSKLATSSQHVLSLVNNILDLSRIEAGRLELAIAPFHPVSELKKLHQLFSLSAQMKGLSLSITHNLPTDCLLLGDAMRLSQVLVNLLDNAIKFTAKGSVTLRVRASMEFNQTYHLHFAIHDSGIGINPATQQVLFVPFSQGDPSISRQYGGSGVGLALSSKLVSLMGSSLELESTPGQGSCFHFSLSLPVLPPPATVTYPHKPPITPVQPFARGLRVLLVDDDEINCFMGKQLLEKLGAAVTLATDGYEAFQQVQQQPFDLVMMDVSMPRMDGYETTRQIRAAGFKHLPIIAVTAHALEDTRKLCMAAGMNGYLSKPFGLDELIRFIKQFPHTAENP